MSQPKIYGWVSALKFTSWPHTQFEYTLPDGSLVTVDGVQESPGPPNCSYPDAEMIGEVRNFVRTIEIPANDLLRRMCLIEWYQAGIAEMKSDDFEDVNVSFKR